jgi:general secretion pathway protein K
VVRNHRISPNDVLRLRLLLERLDQPREWVEALVDWIDPDNDLSGPDGAEMLDYMDRHPEPTYRPANRPLISVTELMSVRGVTPRIYRRLSPYVTALPEWTPINVNTAPEPVLLSLGEGLGPYSMEEILERRLETPYTSVGAFVKDPALVGSEVITDGLSVSSRYFLVTVDAEVGEGRMRLLSLMHRPQPGRVLVLRRGQGVL